MPLLKDVIGQNNAVKYLSGSLAGSRISSSYLFAGPRGVGKAFTAKAFLREILLPESVEESGYSRYAAEIGKIDRLEHPDVKWIIPEKNKNIGIDEIRQVKDLLYMKPFSSARNAAVIEDAHMMTQEASNALLKVLEEPPENSMLILISDKKELIPATVLSRCSHVGFSALSISDAKRLIMEKSGTDEDTAGMLARFCQGSAGMALEYIEKGLGERREALNSVMESLTGGESDAFRSWYSENKDVLIEDVETAVVILRDAVFSRLGFSGSILRTDIAGRLAGWRICGKDIGEIYSAMERLAEMKRALKGNVNPKVAAQALPFTISGRSHHFRGRI